MQTLQHPIVKVCACVVAFLVCFALIGSALSHHLFFWGNFSYSAASSKTALWAMFAVAGVLAAAVMRFCHPSFPESLLAGVLCAVAAGGAYCIGYSAPFLVALIVAVVFFVIMFALRGAGNMGTTILRAVYISLGVGLAFSLVTFLVNASTLHEVKNLTNSALNVSLNSRSSTSGASSGSVSNTSSGSTSSGASSSASSATSLSSASSTSSGAQITNAEWSVMNDMQRENFLAGVVSAEAERLGLDNIVAITCILPEDVPATTDERGRVLINFAAVRVQSPSTEKVLQFEANNGISWTYEELTSPSDIVLATCHAVAHVYEQRRVAGELEEQRSWPYEDASDADGNNTVLDEWSKNLPVNPSKDNGSTSSSGSNKLESQAWGYAYTRVSAYVKSS